VTFYIQKRARSSAGVTLNFGVIVFPGSGITGNLADNAKRVGIPVWRFGGA